MTFLTFIQAENAAVKHWVNYACTSWNTFNYILCSPSIFSVDFPFWQWNKFVPVWRPLQLTTNCPLFFSQINHYKWVITVKIDVWVIHYYWGMFCYSIQNTTILYSWIFLIGYFSWIIKLYSKKVAWSWPLCCQKVVEKHLRLENFWHVI